MLPHVSSAPPSCACVLATYHNFPELGGVLTVGSFVPYCCSYTEEQKEAAIKKAMEAAMNRTFATDRIILDSWKPVPAVSSPVIALKNKGQGFALWDKLTNCAIC